LTLLVPADDFEKALDIDAWNKPKDAS